MSADREDGSGAPGPAKEPSQGVPGEKRKAPSGEEASNEGHGGEGALSAAASSTPVAGDTAPGDTAPGGTTTGSAAPGSTTPGDSAPEERIVVANGLRHHVLVWDAPGPTVLLAHGFLDLAWSWEGVARMLQRQGFRCVAWDWRGHGESEHIGAGGYYHFPDYVLDLEELLPQLRRADEPVHLVGHSMGGTVSTMFAGVRGDALASVTLIEGLGPPAAAFSRTPGRVRAWLDGVAKQRQRAAAPPRPMSLRSCLSRMRIQNPELPEALGLFLAEKGTRAVPGGRVWRFDPLHRTTSPMPFRVEIFGAFLERIRIPSLVVMGEKGFRLPDERERLAPLSGHRFVEIAEVGHMIHWLRPEALAEAWLAFVRDADVL